jgi:hypothetical protein
MMRKRDQRFQRRSSRRSTGWGIASHGKIRDHRAGTDYELIGGAIILQRELKAPKTKYTAANKVIKARRQGKQPRSEDSHRIQGQCQRSRKKNANAHTIQGGGDQQELLSKQIVSSANQTIQTAGCNDGQYKHCGADSDGSGGKKKYGWIGQEPSSGFSDQTPATLGVFASLDRF